MTKQLAARPSHEHHHHAGPTNAAKIFSAFFYGASSLAIMFVNKLVLSSSAKGFYGFPSFKVLSLTQFVVTSAILWVLKRAGRVQITELSPDVASRMAPLATISLLNVLSGLGGTKRLNLPMFTVLRRFSIPMTMGLERLLLRVRPSGQVQLSVFLMVFGALVAALSDLAFDLEGYLLIFANDVFTALNGVVMKQTLVSSAASLSKLAVLFYNSCFGAIVMLCLLALQPAEVEAVRAFPLWGDARFVATFALAAVMGSVLNYATFLCTVNNSALTTTVIGCLKNVLTTYLSMLLLSDYAFSWQNFLGLNISIIGSFIYSYVEIKKQRAAAAAAAPGAGAGASGGGTATGSGHLKAKRGGSSGGGSGRLAHGSRGAGIGMTPPSPTTTMHKAI